MKVIFEINVRLFRGTDASRTGLNELRSTNLMRNMLTDRYWNSILPSFDSTWDGSHGVALTGNHITALSVCAFFGVKKLWIGDE